MMRGDWNVGYLSELSFFPYSKYKDQVDASSGSFNILNKRKKIAGSLFRRHTAQRHPGHKYQVCNECLHSIRGSSLCKKCLGKGPGRNDRWVKKGKERK